MFVEMLHRVFSLSLCILPYFLFFSFLLLFIYLFLDFYVIVMLKLWCYVYGNWIFKLARYRLELISVR